MRVKVTIREIQSPAPIAETTMNKGIQTIYESMRVKPKKTFYEKSLPEEKKSGPGQGERSINLISSIFLIYNC